VFLQLHLVLVTRFPPRLSRSPTTTFASYDSDLDDLSQLKSCLLIRECENVSLAQSSKRTREILRSTPNLVLIIFEVNESLKGKVPEFNKSEMFNERPWIVQLTSTVDKSSIIFFHEVEISFMAIVGERIASIGD
jgi:hypothetical protein